ncbi:hypothetical protein AB0G05_42690 [Nonomuraea wenchangensis]
MDEEREAHEFLLRSGFLHDLQRAHEAATLIVFGALNRSDGFKDRSFGYTSFDVLESQLDRIFGIGTSSDDQGRLGEDAEGVVRGNLNGSPGWRCGPYRVLLKHYDLGEVDTIRWDKLSATKQAVSRQEFRENPQLALNLSGLDREPEDLDIVTLVLAHAASDEPLEMELFLGRPRYNADAGSPWWWRTALTRESLGPDPRTVHIGQTTPLWSDTDLDVPLQLKARSAGTQHETA